MENTNRPRTCLSCHHPLPGMSKMSQLRIPADEARRMGWQCEDQGTESVEVPMCLQCQILFAERVNSGR